MTIPCFTEPALGHHVVCAGWLRDGDQAVEHIRERVRGDRLPGGDFHFHFERFLYFALSFVGRC